MIGKLVVLFSDDEEHMDGGAQPGWHEVGERKWTEVRLRRQKLIRLEIKGHDRLRGFARLGGSRGER